jgi:arginine exporter protein ArgO
MGKVHKIVKEKAFIIILCVVGLVAVSYGMTMDNDVIFIIGIIFVIAGYLMIRTRIKKSIREKEGERGS